MARRGGLGLRSGVGTRVGKLDVESPVAKSADCIWIGRNAAPYNPEWKKLFLIVVKSVHRNNIVTYCHTFILMVHLPHLYQGVVAIQVVRHPAVGF